METLVERIAKWIEEEITGVQDFTLRIVCPKILDWQVSDFKHGDVIMEFINIVPHPALITTTSRAELATWKLYGIIRTLPENTDADTMLDHMSETIKKVLLSKSGRACGGLAVSINFPEIFYRDMAGGVVAEMTVQVGF